MIPSISESLSFFILYKEKECNLSECTLFDMIAWVAPHVVLPTSGASSLLGVRWWAHQDSNLGPTGYEPVALAN